MNSARKIRVAVVFGGRSSEHAISAVSAGSVFAALDPDEFEVVPIGITREGQWVMLPGDPGNLAIEDRKLPEVTAGSGSAVALWGNGSVVPLDPAAGVASLGDVDVVLPILHGPYGEDGTIQGLLEMTGVPYVGAGVFASAAGMDKEFTRKLLAAEGLPIGPWAVLRAGQHTLSEADQERLGLPVFVKPARGGSSIGISKVDDWAELDAAIAVARQHDTKVVIEAGIAGREIECGVLEGEYGGEPEASLLSEIRIVNSAAGWYDFDTKYLDDACEYDIPAHLPAELAGRIRAMAVRAFGALDCEGLARVDFFVTPELDIYINEINTMPGFTPISQFPQMWAASGLDYPKLVSRMIRTALRKRS
ncbi:D-alanine--D-alanine ligase family protein [Longispora albida]|uniref:D-alanine--D-alanine ligase family protein n=1 Tax=Longispora albida TaxID=203523 RepID=UPI000364849E|nr:D-alanine--D-alanine ligase family protein [Longispora albida]